METNEIMTNNEVVEEVAEKVVETAGRSGLKAAGGVGLAVVAGIVVWEKVLKPSWKWAKNKRSDYKARKANGNPKTVVIDAEVSEDSEG